MKNRPFVVKLNRSVNHPYPFKRLDYHITFNYVNEADLEDEKTPFEHCWGCDIPDACSDIGCAEKQGLRKSNEW